MDTKLSYASSGCRRLTADFVGRTLVIASLVAPAIAVAQVVSAIAADFRFKNRIPVGMDADDLGGEPRYILYCYAAATLTVLVGIVLAVTGRVLRRTWLAYLGMVLNAGMLISPIVAFAYLR
jgi:exosortase/archaeosortase